MFGLQRSLLQTRTCRCSSTSGQNTTYGIRATYTPSSTFSSQRPTGMTPSYICSSLQPLQTFSTPSHSMSESNLLVNSSDGTFRMLMRPSRQGCTRYLNNHLMCSSPYEDSWQRVTSTQFHARREVLTANRCQGVLATSSLKTTWISNTGHQVTISKCGMKVSMISWI